MSIKTYCKRVWLNGKKHHSTGSATAYAGKGTHKDFPISVFFEVADCHCKARLHKTSVESVIPFIRKLRKLAKTANDFADYLEANKDMYK